VSFTDPFYQLADWLESYAQSLELNVWTSSTVVKAVQDASTHHWIVTVKLSDGRERVLRPHHLVFAIGVGGGFPNMPVYPGMDKFGGQILHSTEHNRATDHAGKKVVVIGSNTSSKHALPLCSVGLAKRANEGHDICADYYNYGVGQWRNLPLSQV